MLESRKGVWAAGAWRGSSAYYGELTPDYFAVPLRCAGPLFEPAGPDTPAALPAVPPVDGFTLSPAAALEPGPVFAAGPFFEPVGPATPLAFCPVCGFTVPPAAGPEVSPELP
jgi:hypothetical protein